MLISWSYSSLKIPTNVFSDFLKIKDKGMYAFETLSNI